jgi:hypothetical protein
MYKLYFAIAAMDALLALLCAMIGNNMCFWFAALSGVMLGCGIAVLNALDKKEGE